MKSLNDKIVNYYDELKSNAEFKAESNLKKALNNKEVRDIYYEIKDTEFCLAKTEIFGTSEEVKKLNIKLKNLKISFEKSLNKIGLKSTDIYPQYLCKTCGDTGVVGTKKCPACYENTLKILQGESKFFLKNSPSFNLEFTPQELLPYHKKLMDFCEKFPSTRIKHLVFTGRTGSGKTYLAECIVDAINKRGFSTAYLTSFTLSELVIEYTKIFDKERLDFLDELINAQLLVIDDFGASSILLDKTAELVSSIITERDVLGKTTIITTNLSPEEIELRYGERLFSRLLNKRISAVIEFKGKDLRITK